MPTEPTNHNQKSLDSCFSAAFLHDFCVISLSLAFSLTVNFGIDYNETTKMKEHTDINSNGVL